MCEMRRYERYSKKISVGGRMDQEMVMVWCCREDGRRETCKESI